MRILFTTGYREEHYTIQAVRMLSGLNDFEDVSIDFFDKNYREYDVILFMGYDPQVREAHVANPNSRIGVIDPRYVTPEIIQADFIVAQGIEEMNWFSDYALDICRYDIYPLPKGHPKTHEEKDTIIIGYHGNKHHLHTMYPYLSTALEALGEQYNVEFWAMYDIKNLGNLAWDLFPKGTVKLREIQWEWDVFEKYFPEVDIGVIPNRIPIANIDKARKNIESFPYVYHEQDEDYILRFKATSNIARLYPFAIFGIPVVADFFPSALHTIQDGATGFIGGSAGMWYRGLEKLAASAELRQEIARRMYEQYLRTATPDVFNRNLVEFLYEVLQRPPRKSPPACAAASERFNDLVAINAAMTPKKPVKKKTKTVSEFLTHLKRKLVM